MGDEKRAVWAKKRLQQIATARQALSDRHVIEPVQRIESRLSKLDAARKRERERFDQRVLGLGPPKPEEPVLSSPPGMMASAWKAERKRLLAAHRKAVAAWRQARKAKPIVSTEAFSRAHSDAIIQLERNGTISAEQAEWVAQISNVHRSISSDVEVIVASLEARVDQSRSSRHLAGESIYRVRMHRAYSIWRELIPAPKQLVLDMIVGDAIGYTVAARLHRVHNRKARRLLLEAIERWPDCVRDAFREVGKDDVERMNDAA